MKTMKYCKNDEYLTPSEAVYPVMKRQKVRAAVWCPFDTEESAYVKVFSEHGFSVHYGHIRTGQDFFQTEVPDCDYIIGNPPYSVISITAKKGYHTVKICSRTNFLSDKYRTEQGMAFTLCPVFLL